MQLSSEEGGGRAGAHLVERGACGAGHARVRVAQALLQRWNHSRQRRRQLAGRAVRHRAQELRVEGGVEGGEGEKMTEGGVSRSVGRTGWQLRGTAFS